MGARVQGDHRLRRPCEGRTETADETRTAGSIRGSKWEKTSASTFPARDQATLTGVDVHALRLSNDDEAWCAGSQTGTVLVCGLASKGLRRDQRDPPTMRMQEGTSGVKGRPSGPLLKVDTGQRSHVTVGVRYGSCGRGILVMQRGRGGVDGVDGGDDRAVTGMQTHKCSRGGAPASMARHAA